MSPRDFAHVCGVSSLGHCAVLLCCARTEVLLPINRRYDPWCPCWENGTNVLLLGNGAEHVGGTHISAASSPAGASTDSGVVDKTSAAATTAVVVTSRLAAGAVTAAALFV
eukprot:COSAG05_NODE_72_length_21963_cov_153.494535_8_plen_111_part_00